MTTLVPSREVCLASCGAAGLHITELWLSDECRGDGLGRQLLETAEREAALSGARGSLISLSTFKRHISTAATATRCTPHSPTIRTDTSTTIFARCSEMSTWS